MYSGHFIGHQLQGRSPGEKLLAQDWPALLVLTVLFAHLCQAEVSSPCLHGPVSTERGDETPAPEHKLSSCSFATESEMCFAQG